MTLIKTVAVAPGQAPIHVEMTADEETDFEAARTAFLAFQSSEQLKSDAQSALDKSDLVAIRCLKAGVVFPSAWQTYVSELRAIVNGGSGPIPDQPSYPEGT